MDVRTIRRHNLERLIREAGGQRHLARRTGVSAAYLSQVLSERVNRNVGHNLARRLEAGMHKPYGWMDVADSALFPAVADRVRERERPEAAYGTPTPRRRGLGRLVAEAGGVAPLAERAAVWLPYLVAVVQGGGGVPWGLARRLEAAMERPRGWMDRTGAR